MIRNLRGIPRLWRPPIYAANCNRSEQCNRRIADVHPRKDH